MLPSVVMVLTDSDHSASEYWGALMEKEGFELVCCKNGQELDQLAQKNPAVDLYVLKEGLPDRTVLEATKLLRENTKAPIIILAESTEDDFLTEAYESGADEVLRLPCPDSILQLRMKANLRRYLTYRGKRKDTNGIIIDEERHLVTKNGQPVEMTDLELSILEYMVEQDGSIVSIQQIYENVWGEKFFPPSANTVMVHILNIRKKLEDSVSHPKLIRTVWGKGYKLSGISYLKSKSV